MHNEAIQELAKKLNLTKPDEIKEEYILSKQEEDTVIENAITALKKHKAYLLAYRGHTQEEIDFKLSQIDFNSLINREDILQRSNSNKHYEIWVKEKRKREAEEKIAKFGELREQCNAKYFYNLMASTSKHVYQKELIVNDDTLYLIKILCLFFGNDSRFETELSFSFNKGLWLRGVSGLGKSHLPSCIKNNPIKPISIHSMITITDELWKYGTYELPTLDNCLYLDDVGTEEPTINRYGTKISFFKNFIEVCYSKYNTFSNLIVSTNNNFDEIEEKYGFRVRSRIKDMFNIIDVEGVDLRGL